MKTLSLVLVVTIICSLSVGCASTSSTMLSRDESNSVWQRHEHLKGVPITLKVPTHVKIYIYEKHFLQKMKVGGVERVQRVKLPFPVRDFAQEFIFDEKIFTVDFKRPAAGAYNLDVDFTKDQYIQAVKHDVTDDTIAKVGDLVGKLAPDILAFPVPDSDAANFSPVSKVGAATLPEIKSVVAVGVFEIDAPDFESKLTEFINCHLNKSHDAWVVPPNVDSINRSGISGSLHETDICEGNIEFFSPSSPVGQSGSYFDGNGNELFNSAPPIPPLENVTTELP